MMMRCFIQVFVFFAMLFPAFGEKPDKAAQGGTENAVEVYLMDGALLDYSRTMIEKGCRKSTMALDRLVASADAELGSGPFSVTDKTFLPPSGDKHDYMSIGIYWWPDPEKEDGLPYIRRDGERNTKCEKEGSDLPRLGMMARAVYSLALAYYFTGEEKYAGHAGLLLKTWFLNPDTLMNPHLKYGQAIPGRVEGRGIGIIDTVSLLRVVDSACLLVGSDHWTDMDHEALRKWFGKYLDWLLTSRHGKAEKRASNNHGTWYDAQVAAFALFSGDLETARNVLESAGPDRFARLIRPDGRQPRELSRTLSFHYSCYGLEAIMALARLGEHAGVDLWRFKLPAGDSPYAVYAALNYIAPYADPEKTWPHRQIREINRARLLPMLRQAYLVYKEEAWLPLIAAVPEAERENDFSVLLYPEGAARMED